MTKEPRLIERTPSAYAYPLLIKQLLHTPLTYMPDNEIVYRDQLRYTYRELFERISRLATGLQALGVEPGDMVAFLDWDSNRYLEAFFAVPMMGAVLHTVNIRLSPEQIAFTMRHAEDKVVIFHQDFLPVIESLREQLPQVDNWIMIREGENPVNAPSYAACDYEGLLAGGVIDHQFSDFDENAMATLFYTTGTTGDPKGVHFSHRQLVLHTLSLGMAVGSYAAQGRFRSDDVYMPLTPMFHVHAWGLPFLATLLGVKQVYPGRYEPPMILKLLASEKVTFSHCVPTILHMLLGSPLVKELDLGAWKVIIGGSALPKGMAASAMDLGIDIYTGYGMSETCPVLTLAALKPGELDTDRERQLEVRTKTGLPIPLVQLDIQGPLGEPMPHDGQSAGEIVARSPWLTQGYFKSQDKSEELWEGGRLHTGDVAVIDRDGYFQITDRLKDVIKTGGEWVSSLELESLISQHPSVSEVAVIGVPDEKWGERPLAMVVPQNGEISVNVLRDFLGGFVEKGLISRWAVPERFHFVESIPKTSVGKLDKKRIRQEVAS